MYDSDALEDDERTLYFCMIGRRGHPLRRVVPGEFAKLYAPIGRPSIPPEKLLRALLLQVFYSVRAERQLIKQLEYNLLFRWFTGLAIDDPVWDVTSQGLRPRIAASFGGIKAVGGLRKTRHQRYRAGRLAVYLIAAACNLIRLPKLLAAG